MLLNFARVKFEDIKVNMLEWEEMKEKFPNMQLPILDIDGVILNQSSDILRYLGSEFGYYSSEPMAAYEADWLVATINDFS